jgi:hypothetical protein
LAPHPSFLLPNETKITRSIKISTTTKINIHLEEASASDGSLANTAVAIILALWAFYSAT